jgi:alanine racemase
MSGELTIELSALARNYKMLDGLSTPECETACVVKADAYGLKVGECAPVLYEAGARSFFVATSAEGIELHSVLPKDVNIYVLGGLSSDEEHGIIPVLNSLAEIKLASINAKNRVVALHFDTGMNRLGLGDDEATMLYQDLSILEGLDLRLVISHFASSEEANNPDNKAQMERFNEVKRRMKPLYPNARYALANSGGIFLGSDYHFDMIRAGLALYGAHPTSSQKDNPMEPVISLNVPVLQVRTAKKGESAGYNSTYHFDEDTTLAIVSIGYADGLPRSLSNEGVFYWKGYALPIRGRVSMDSVICDLAGVPLSEHPTRGDMIEVIGPNQSLDALASSASTISYEILTSLGRRYRRVYK